MKRDFIVRRSITMIDGKPHVETYSETELVRCKDCKWAEVSDDEHTWCDHVDHEFCHDNDWYCADAERKDIK